MGKLIGAAVALLGLAAVQAGAQSGGDGGIVLRSLDGSSQLRGDLLGFDGGRFTLRTALGTLTVDAAQVVCEGAACPADPMFGATFAIAGSNTIGDALMPALVQGYADSLGAVLVRQDGGVANETLLRVEHSDGRSMAEIALAAHGSGTAVAALAAGAPIGMSSRELREAEVRTLVAAGLPDPRGTEAEIVLALDGLLILVHPDNPLTALSVAEIGAMFAGRIDNWAQVGGPDLPVTLHARDDKSGTYDTFESLVLAPQGLALSPAARRYEDSEALSDAVTADPGGIGFAGAAYARAARVLAVRQDCGIVSTPTDFALKTEEYPLSRRLYLYTRAEGMTLHARALVDFAQSDAAQGVIAESGFTDRTVARRRLADQGERLIASLAADQEFSLPLMREMLADLGGAERLSTTFRFTPGSSRLDPKSAREALVLARQLAAGVFRGREVLLIGFTDAVGEFGLNQGLATRRAEALFQTLRDAVPPGALDATSIAVRGYGELTPVGCNTTFEGRLANRRVEVWVRPGPR